MYTQCFIEEKLKVKRTIASVLEIKQDKELGRTPQLNFLIYMKQDRHMHPKSYS